MNPDDMNDYNELDRLMFESPKISIAFGEIGYFKNIVNFIPEQELDKIEELYDFMFEKKMIDGDFMPKYRYLKIFREHKKSFDVLNSMGRKIVVSKN